MDDTVPTQLDPDEALSEMLAGAGGTAAGGRLCFPLSDGSSAFIEEISGDDEPLTRRLLEILSELDPAGVGGSEDDDYHPEAHDLAQRLRAVPAGELEEDRVAALIAEVLRHWFAEADGSATAGPEPEDCRPAARQVLLALGR